jgi:hypothetical protein
MFEAYNRWVKRLVLSGFVVAALCAGCGAALGTKQRALHRTAVDRIAARREASATRSAQKLLREVVLPPGARFVTTHLQRFERANGELDPGVIIGPTYADVHRFWIAHTTLASAKEFEETWMPPGLEGRYRNERNDPFSSFAFGHVSHRVETKSLEVAMLQRRKALIVGRVDAYVRWIVPRSPQEVVPAGVVEIDLKTPHVTLRVTDARRVGLIARSFNRLLLGTTHIPGPFCSGTPWSPAQLEFRSSSGAIVATAYVPMRRTSLCQQVEFLIHGKPEPPLVDRDRGPSFAARLQHLLGAKLR